MNSIEYDPIVGLTREKFKSVGIEAVLLDLDDTVIYTSEIFTKYINEYIDQVSEKIVVDRNQFAQNLDRLNVSLHKKYGVNPERWKGVVEGLAEIYSENASEIIENLWILNLIYSTVPREKTGASAVLETFSKAGLKVVLVTHANVEWTNWKLDQLGLWRHFDAIVIADENGSKNPEHWMKCATMLEVVPGNCLAIGDNIGGDMQAANSLGMKTAWIPSPWAVYREGQLPENTIKIEELFDIFEAMT